MSIEEYSPGLRKTSLLKGIQCPKALFLSKNPPLVEIPPDPDQDATFQMGREVRLLARQLFPGGTEVPFSNQTLTRRKFKKDRKHYEYKARPKVCNECDLKDKCTKSKSGRTLKRHERQDDLDGIVQRSKSKESKKDSRTR